MSQFTRPSANYRVSAKVSRTFAKVFLVCCFIFAGAKVFDRQNTWMNPEQHEIKSRVLSNGLSFVWGDFLRVFDTYTWELSPRCSRIFSSFFEIIDTKFRAGLWTFLVPYPNLSLMNLLVLFLCPYLLFLILRRFKVEDSINYLLVGFYFCSTSTLSLLSMNFRPAKALVHAAILLMIYWGGLVNKKSNKSFVFLYLATILGLLCDETAAVGFLFVILFYRNNFSKKQLYIYAGLPFLYLAIINLVIPLISKKLGYGFPEFFTYEPAFRVPRFFKLKHLPNYFINLWIFIKESFDIFNPFLFKGVFARSFFLLSDIALASWVLWLGRNLYQQKKSLFLTYFILFLILFHSILMRATENMLWGPYWYAIYIQLFLILWLAEASLTVKKKLLFAGPLIFVCLLQTQTFGYLNSRYFMRHYYPCQPLKIIDVFLDKENRFENEVSEFKSIDRNQRIKDFYAWAKDKKNGEFKLPVDLYYLPIEMGLKVQVPTAMNLCDSRNFYFTVGN
jgi:hypothetical protein